MSSFHRVAMIENIAHKKIHASQDRKKKHFNGVPA
jgi:hypothetical protein